jgi:hypothetical protein
MSNSLKRKRNSIANSHDAKRARVDDLNAHSRALLDKMAEKYILPMKIADKFFDHVKEIFNHECMYWQDDSTFMSLDNPSVSFDWCINDDDECESFNISTQSKPLQAFFDKYNDKPLWQLTPEERLDAHEMLTEYFAVFPTVDLVIENWSNDCVRVRGGRIGASTGGKWVEAEPGSSEEEFD